MDVAPEVVLPPQQPQGFLAAVFVQRIHQRGGVIAEQLGIRRVLQMLAQLRPNLVLDGLRLVVGGTVLVCVHVKTSFGHKVSALILRRWTRKNQCVLFGSQSVLSRTGYTKRKCKRGSCKLKTNAAAHNNLRRTGKICQKLEKYFPPRNPPKTCDFWGRQQKPDSLQAARHGAVWLFFDRPQDVVGDVLMPVHGGVGIGGGHGKGDGHIGHILVLGGKALAKGIQPPEQLCPLRQ